MTEKIKKDESNKFDNVHQLSRKMQGRYHLLNPIYKDKTLLLFENLTIRGKNSYEPVYVKIHIVNKSTGKERDYFRTLTASVSLDVTQNITSVMNAVCNARSKHGLEPLKGNIQRLCVEELYKVFLIKEVSLPGTDGKNHTAYIPKFAFLIE